MPLEHERNYGLDMDALVSGTQTLLWFEHGCTGERMLSKRERYYALGMDDRMLSKHERYYGLGMDAPVSVCSRNTERY